jgi:hypothetical protein
MKKLLVVAAVIFSAAAAQAQVKFGIEGDFSSSSIATIGFGANAEFPMSDAISIQASFIYFLPKTEDQFGLPGKWQTFAINGDVHYTFAEKFYGIGGLSYVNTSYNYDGGSLGAFSPSAGGIGLNLGVGGNFGGLFAEAKYNTQLSGLLATVGYKFGGN